MPFLNKEEEIVPGMENLETTVLKDSPVAGHFLSLEQYKEKRHGLCMTCIHEAAGLVFSLSVGLT